MAQFVEGKPGNREVPGSSPIVCEWAGYASDSFEDSGGTLRPRSIWRKCLGLAEFDSLSQQNKHKIIYAQREGGRERERERERAITPWQHNTFLNTHRIAALFRKWTGPWISDSGHPRYHHWFPRNSPVLLHVCVAMVFKGPKLQDLDPCFQTKLPETSCG